MRSLQALTQAHREAAELIASTVYPVGQPSYAYVGMCWSVKMSDGSVRRFTRRSDAESLLARRGRPASILRAAFAASVEAR